MMFDPNNQSASKTLKIQRKRANKDIKNWCTLLVPEPLREGLIMDVKDVICGDPNCAPVDTCVTLVWGEGGRGVFALPFAPEELSQEDMNDLFPDIETLAKWKNGERSPWPKRPPLRFDVGARVECRVGPHPVKGWCPGKVIKLHYSEPSWPPNMVAPYQVALHDGRLIFAPQDVNEVIRLRPPAAEDAPSSPPVSYPDGFFQNTGQSSES